MEKDKKINYFNIFLEEIKNIKEVDKNPKLLLHVCCGACSAYPLLFLVKLFDITIYFTNSNIYPYEEYMKRLNALIEYVNYLNIKFNSNIKVISDEYNYEEFKKDLLPYKNEKEGLNRCKICILKRIKKAFIYAKENKYKYLTTVMSVSRNKDVNYINEIGKTLEKEFPEVKFLVTDFKKENGQDIGVNITKKLNIYRQNYCGCEFSNYGED